MGLESWRPCPERCARPGWACLGHPQRSWEEQPWLCSRSPAPGDLGRGERPSRGAGVPQGSQKGPRGVPEEMPSLPTWKGQPGASRALPREEVRLAGIRIPWARAESRPRGVCRQAGGGGCRAKRGAQPKLQPLSRASPLLMSLQGHQAPSQSRCHRLTRAVTRLPSSFPSPSAAFAMIHVCPWQQMVAHIKQTTVPFPWGGRQTIPARPWKQLKQCQASAQLVF